MQSQSHSDRLPTPDADVLAATISTRGIATAQAPDDANSRAQLFYANFGGFVVADFTYGLSRSLRPSPAL